MKSLKRQTFAEYLAEKSQQPKMLTPEEFEDRVVDVVTSRLGSRRWFQGVCLNNVMDYYPDRLSEAIHNAELNTIEYDSYKD